MTKDSQLFAAGEYLSSLSLIAFMWFVGSLWAALRRAEGDAGWLAFVAAASGLMVVAKVSARSGWVLAVFRKDEGLAPQIARLLFDQGNFAFANASVMLASLLLATGIVSIQANALPHWLSWASIVIASSLLAARAVWASSQLVFVLFGLCYLWLIAISIVLFRRARALENARRPAQEVVAS